MMVSVGVSRMGKTGIIFCELGAKVSNSYSVASPGFGARGKEIKRVIFTL